jgi:hypothetical protein
MYVTRTNHMYTRVRLVKKFTIQFLLNLTYMEKNVLVNFYFNTIDMH